MMCTVRLLSRMLFVGGINQLHVKHRERFLTALKDESRPLITVANHRCNIDDPLMWAMMSWTEFFSTIHRQRYTLAAHNICFTTQLHTTFFSLGRCVPCVRGGGVFQKGMDFSVEALNKNQWVHIFPEAKVAEAPIRIKWGVGRLVLEPTISPIIIPIWLKGMDEVWPGIKPFYPRFKKKVEMVVGEPWDPTEFRKKLLKSDYSERQKRKLATDRVQRLMFNLAETTPYVEKGTLDRIERENKRDIESFR